MGDQRLHSSAWDLIRHQHGVIARRQLLELGYSSKAIKHRLGRGRLRQVHQGVYAVKGPDLTQHGHWMAAVLSCGPSAVLSGESAAVLGSMRRWEGGPIEVSVPKGAVRRARGLAVRRRL